MKVALISWQKLGFATDEIPKPIAGNKERDAWETCNGLVLSWLFNVMEPEIAKTLLYIDSTVVTWSDLQDHYKIANKPQIFQMEHEISVMNQGDDSVCVYFQKLKSLLGPIGLMCAKTNLCLWKLHMRCEEFSTVGG